MSGRGEEIMDFIEGKFLYAATPDGQRGGYKVIFMVFNNIRNMACGILPRLYLMLIKVIRFRFPNCTLLLRLLTGTFIYMIDF